MCEVEVPSQGQIQTEGRLASKYGIKDLGTFLSNGLGGQTPELMQDIVIALEQRNVALYEAGGLRGRGHGPGSRYLYDTLGWSGHEVLATRLHAKGFVFRTSPTEPPKNKRPSVARQELVTVRAEYERRMGKKGSGAMWMSARRIQAAIAKSTCVF